MAEHTRSTILSGLSEYAMEILVAVRFGIQPDQAAFERQAPPCHPWTMTGKRLKRRPTDPIQRGNLI
jgi:hypothetical protein